MKKMKKLVGILLTLAMVVAMSVTAFAKPETITINGGAANSKYKAYKLLNATDGGDGKYAYTLNAEYKDILQTVTGKNTDKDIIEYIAGLDAAATRTFADAVYAAIKTDESKAGISSSVVDNAVEISAKTGYYLIVETETGNKQDAYSLAMLGTVGNDGLAVNTKEGVPTLEKKVQEKDDSTGTTTGWQDGADYDIGDDVPFKLTGTVSDKYDNYGSYAYTFHDKMSNGLTFNNDVKVYVDGTPITTGYTVVTENLTDTDGNVCTFEVRFENLKNISSVNANSKITVEYTAKLNEKAVIGSAGNPNEARLEYSNNPYGEGTGKTPWDKVIVFTYKLVANKVDGSGNALAGAGFTLYKWNEAKDKYEAVGSEIKGTDKDPKTTFEFSRLDAGQYKLVETTVPAGYNKAADLEFKVVASYDTDKADPEFGTLKVTDLDNHELTGVFTIDQKNDDAVTTNITNLSGTELPSTGGMGTTILYVIGAILVIGAGILLVTKKRMNANK